MNNHIKKDHQVVSGEKKQKNIHPLRTFHLPSSAMISLLVKPGPGLLNSSVPEIGFLTLYLKFSPFTLTQGIFVFRSL